MAVPIRSSIQTQVYSSRSRVEESLVLRAKSLVEAFKAGTPSIEEVSTRGQELITEAIALVQGGTPDLETARAVLASLLSLEIESLEKRTLEDLVPLLAISTLSYDLENKQAENLLLLEKQMCGTIEHYFRNSFDENFMVRLLSTYEDILEHLWLLAYLSDDPATYTAVVERGAPKITAQTERMLGLLKRALGSCPEFPTKYRSIRASLRLLRTPLSDKEKLSLRELSSNPNDPYFPEMLAQLYHAFGHIDRTVHHYRVALCLVEKCTQEREDLQNLKGKILGDLGNAYSFLGEYKRAIECHEKSLELAGKMGNCQGEAASYSGLGDVYRFLGEYKRAIEHYKKSLAIAREIGNRHVKAASYGNLGNSYYFLGEYKRAIEYYEESLAIAREIEDLQGKAASYTGLGSAYFSLGEYKRAIECHEKSLELAEKIGDRQGKAASYTGLGNAYHFLREYRRAIEYHEKCLAIFLEIGNPQGEAASNGDLGVSYTSLGEYGGAIEYHEKSLAISLEIGNRQGEASSYGNLGNAYDLLGDSGRAIECYEMSLEIAREIGDRQGVANSYTGQGDAYRSRGEYRRAIEYHEMSLKIAREIEDLQGKTASYTGLGSAYFSLGEYKRAIKCHKKSLELAEKIGDRQGKASSYTGLGSAYRFLGEYKRAIEYYEKCLALALEIGDRQGEAVSYLVLGNAYFSLGEHRRAIEYHEKCLAIGLEIGNRQGEAASYGNLGNAYGSMEEHKRAIECHEKCLAIALEIGYRQGEAASYLGLGSAYFSLGDYGRAIEYYERSLAIAREIGNRQGEANSYIGLGNAYFSLGENKRAIECHEKSLAIAREIEDLQGEAASYGNLGNVYRMLDEFHLAETQFRHCLPIYAELQKNLGSMHQQKITSFEKQSVVYYGLEAILLIQNRANDALEVSDSRRSKVLIDRLRAKVSPSQSPSDTIDPLKIEQIKEQASKLNATFVVFSFAKWRNAAHFGVWVISPSGEVEYRRLPVYSLGEDLNSLEKLFAGSPISGGGEEESFPSPSYLKGLGHDVPEDSDSEYDSDLEFELASMASAEQEDLHAASKERSKEFSEEERVKFLERLKVWYDTLIAPIEDLLPLDDRSNITLIGDGFLNQMPFATFRDSEGRYLFEKCTLSFAPSLKTLQLLLARKTELDALLVSHVPLIVGNPDTGKEGEGLPQAHKEAVVVGAVLGAKGDQVLTHAQAGASNVATRMQEATTIHFACRGKRNEKKHVHSLCEGALALSPDEDHKEGYLYAEDIAAMDLKASLVVMSACDSGRGKIQSEGVIGNVRSLHAAGVPTVVGTLWKIPDAPLTVDMMELFHTHVQEGTSVAAALKRAMEYGAEQERENPKAWGAFYASGLSMLTE